MDNPKYSISQNKDDYLDEFRRSLPIYQYREDMVKLIKENLFCIITGDTGSGKTTQLPQYVIEHLKACDLLYMNNNEEGIKEESETVDKINNNSNIKLYDTTIIKSTIISKSQIDVPKIVITQPRRVAAIQMAKRVSYERRSTLGKEVGYSIRFEDCSSEETIVKFVTDGILVRECLADHNLSKYNVIILDEAHERSLYTDILFALCKKAVLKRNGDLRMIITSATLDTKQFSSYFNNCPVFQVAGRSHPVDIVYFNSRMEKRVENSVKLAIRIHLHESPGHILSFLTGFEECEQACKLCYQKLEELASKGKNVPPMVIMPLYGAQNTDEQGMIFDKVPDNCRKLIFSTNIAETSLTVDGIGYVIDCGYVKQKIFNSKTSMDSLTIVPISKVQAVQRTGRAGRTGPGKCIRLYSEQFFETQMSKASIPEILRVNLASTILTLKSMGIDNIVDFDFMEKPEKESILEALKQLYYLQAIDQDGRITRLGIEISKFPLDCTYSRCLIASHFFNIKEEMNTLVSLISCENVWFNVNKYDEERKAIFDQKKLEFVDKFSDHMSFLNIYKEWEYNNFSEDWCKQNFLHYRALKQARKIRDQIFDYMSKIKFKECESFYNLKNIKYLISEVETDSLLDDYEKVNTLMRMALCQGFFMNAAKRMTNTTDSSSYLRISDGNVVTLDQYSAISVKGLKPDFVIYTELGGSTSRAMMKQASIIDLKWINDLIYLIKNVDVFRLRGKVKTPPQTVLNLYKNLNNNSIDLYSILDKKKTPGMTSSIKIGLNNQLQGFKDLEYEKNFEIRESNVKDGKFEEEITDHSNILEKKAEEAKERYLKRKLMRENK